MAVNAMLETLKKEKLVAILRGVPEDRADPVAEALIRGGVRLLEATMNTDGALDMISRWRQRFGDRVFVGAGTVLDRRMAEEAVAAGAQFLISPNLDEEVVAYGLDRGIDVWPGVMTPTEIVRAWKAGASAVKVFPTASLGVKYIREVRAPLGHIPMIATGGVSLDNIRDFLEAGVVAVGLGGNLVDKNAVREGRYDDIEQTARRFVEAAR
jgi:2-dehydro-3-deoxyphosphogluconate aldolase/(4S)-4-hydroxy-2-oxoglutarate aldolase